MFDFLTLSLSQLKSSYCIKISWKTTVINFIKYSIFLLFWLHIYWKFSSLFKLLNWPLVYYERVRNQITTYYNVLLSSERERERGRSGSIWVLTFYGVIRILHCDLCIHQIFNFFILWNSYQHKLTSLKLKLHTVSCILVYTR